MRAAQQSTSRNASTRVRRSRASPGEGATESGSESLKSICQFTSSFSKVWLDYTPLGQSVSEGPSDEGPGRLVTLKPAGILGVVACS